MKNLMKQIYSRDTQKYVRIFSYFFDQFERCKNNRYSRRVFTRCELFSGPRARLAG